jgi:mannose/cellobiose epimerase-like protein (N-acyl-D-glucosamine 2-epimerase family)
MAANPPPQNKPSRKLLRWSVFGILFALAPFLITILFRWSDGKDFDWNALWPQGELLIASAAIAADALGDVIATESESSSAKIICGGGCILMVLGSGAWFGKIQTAATAASTARITVGSAIIFVITLCVAVVCKQE